MNIKVVIIDDYDFYRWLLRSFLKGEDIVVLGDFTQKSFVQSVIDPIPEIVIISHRKNQSEILETIVFTKDKFPAVKIIVTISIHDKARVEEIKKIGVQGLVFKMENDPDEIIKAIKAVHNNETYL